MTLHQNNADGAGPMACSVDATGTGAKFQTMTITKNVPGNNGVSKANNEDFPLVATMPAGVACSGNVAGINNLCFVKCQNPRGPFGGVVAVQMGGAGTGNSTAAGNAAGAGRAGNSTAASTSTTQGGKKAGKGTKNPKAKAGRAAGVRAMLGLYV